MKNFRRLVDYLMLVDFLALALTGIIKFLELETSSIISRVHDWSGIILVLLIIFHLFFNLKILFVINTNNRQILKKIGIIVLIVALIAVFALLVFNEVKKNQPIKLSSVEVRDYNGQKLDSVNNIEDNAIKGTQYIDQKSYALKITGLIGKEASYSYDQVLSFPKYQKVVQLNCVEGWSANILWEGILVKDLLKDLSVKSEAKTIIFYAADGYSTSFPIEWIMNNNIMLAYKMNGVILPAQKGFPFQLVAEQKWGYKWIKWITKIELSSDINYKGYWEQRGYNNNGDVSGSKFQ